MKTHKVNLLLIISALLATIIGCSKDDAEGVGSIPEFQSLTETISSLPGQTFMFTGVISDPAGIQSINIKYEPWFLNKTIVKSDSLYKTYNLEYQFKVPSDAIKNSSHTIPVTITNSGGKTITKNVIVTLNLDISKPVMQVLQPINGATVLIGNGDEIDFDITVTDEELSEFKIESSILNETISISGTSYTYTKSLNVENSGSYTFKITATDVTGNTTVMNILVNIPEELSFDVMYITDVTNDALLVADLFGIPYKTDASVAVEEDGFVFTAKYYAANPNTQVRFIPQKSSFAPYSFGANPNVAGELVLGTDASVDPIVLPQVGYYEIKMDLKNKSYTVTPYTPADTPYNQVYILGRGITVGSSSTCINNTTGATSCWHFNSGKPFVKDANNAYLWTVDVSVADEPNDEGANGFILNANPSGWAPFWRVDNAEDPESTLLGNGQNYVFPDDALGKDYTFIFDTHLNRISVINR
ncbi:hypothetical protein [Mariniflexile sp.]|uniref:hypothetical protein n=1 Tax=Mariniflexile sp. TaxID=1979402 RepID=UPI00356778DB